MEVVIKIEVKDNNVEQALRVLKRKLQRDGFFKIIKLKNTYEKPSEKKKRILQENIKRVKKWEMHESPRTQEENLEIFKSVKRIFDIENPKHKPATTSFKTTVKRRA